MPGMSETNKHTHVYLAAPCVKVAEPILYDLLDKYFDMSVLLIPVEEALAQLGVDIDGMETVGALLRAAPHLMPYQDR